jgi:hypothetical protein
LDQRTIEFETRHAIGTKSSVHETAERGARVFDSPFRRTEKRNRY